MAAHKRQAAVGKCGLLVDELTSASYVFPVMLRRLLTALALITGLAATGAPASAAVAEAVSAEAQATSGTSRLGSDQACVCILQRGLDPMKQMPSRNCKAVERPVVVYLPTVQLGSDRSLQ